MVILHYEWLVATFANVEDTDKNRAISKWLSSIVDDSDCEDTAPGNVDVNNRMSAEFGAYQWSKTEPIHTDPLQFWKNKDSTYPNAVMQSQKLLCLPGTHNCSLNSLQTCWTSLSLSVPSECILSDAGKIVSKRRSALHPVNVKMLLCLQSWLQ